MLFGVVAVPAAAAWPLVLGDPSGHRVTDGKGTAPRRHGPTLTAEAPLCRLMALAHRRLATADEEGSLRMRGVADRRRLPVLLRMRGGAPHPIKACRSGWARSWPRW